MAMPEFRGPTFKVLGIGLLTLLMLIPLAQVQRILAERAAARDEAVSMIASRWGGMQQVGGPVLAVPFERQVERVRKGVSEWRREQGTVLVLADRLRIDGSLSISERAYGIFSTPVYTSKLALDGEFLPGDLPVSRDDERIEWKWSAAELRLPIADVGGVRGLGRLEVDGAPRRAVPSPASVAGVPVVSIPLGLTGRPAKPLRFRIKLDLAGTRQIHFLPLARATHATLRAPWPHPGFDGGRLPSRHSVRADGFVAEWDALELNRRYAQAWSDSEDMRASVGESAFGVALLQPVDDYARNVRTGKYGLLFIALTFLALFLFEVLRRLRVHPVQYLLVGLALSCFYLLLLALSEQIGFDLSYLVAAASVAAIVGAYAASVLARVRDGVILGGGVAGLYALLYGLIISERYALLIGSIGLLATVAALMYLTRRIDWYRQSAGADGAIESDPGASGGNG